MKRDKLRIGVITAALAMMIAGGVLTWQQDARNGKADQAKQGETAQLTEDESTGTTEQQTEETAGDADGTRAVQDQADDVENSLEQVPEMEAACEEEAVGNPEADAETAQNTPEESDGNTERQDAQAVNGTAADQNGETGSGETAANEETSLALAVYAVVVQRALAKFRAKGPMMYYLRCIVDTAATVLYLLIGSIIIGQSVFTAEVAGSIIGSIVMLFVNIPYFNNRKHLFVNP